MKSSSVSTPTIFIADPHSTGTTLPVLQADLEALGNVFVTERALVEILLHQRIVHLGHGLDQRLAHAL